MKILDTLTEKQRMVYGAVEESDKPVTPAQIIEQTGLNESTVRSYVRLLETKGLLSRDVHGHYVVSQLVATGRMEEQKKSSVCEQPNHYATKKEEAQLELELPHPIRDCLVVFTDADTGELLFGLTPNGITVFKPYNIGIRPRTGVNNFKEV